jgi:hypothetical protein
MPEPIGNTAAAVFRHKRSPPATAAPILAHQINLFCTPQLENAERSETAPLGRFPFTVGSRCVTVAKWSGQWPGKLEGVPGLRA